MFDFVGSRSIRWRNSRTPRRSATESSSTTRRWPGLDLAAPPPGESSAAGPPAFRFRRSLGSSGEGSPGIGLEDRAYAYWRIGWGLGFWCLVFLSWRLEIEGYIRSASCGTPEEVRTCHGRPNHGSLGCRRMRIYSMCAFTFISLHTSEKTKVRYIRVKNVSKNIKE